MPQKTYSVTMTFADVIRFVRREYSPDRADRIIARMQNGADYNDAIWATSPERRMEVTSNTGENDAV